MDNVRTILCDLPNSIDGFVKTDDDFYTIILNKNLSHERNMATYYHELSHIVNGDYEKRTSAGMIEFYAHK